MLLKLVLINDIIIMQYSFIVHICMSEVKSMDENTVVVDQENTAPGAILSDSAKAIGDAISDFAAIFIWFFDKIKELFAKIGL